MTRIVTVTWHPLGWVPQALWSQAREQLPVTTVICSNGAYAILKVCVCVCVWLCACVWL